MATVPRATIEDVDRCVEASRAALNHSDWKNMDPAQRGRILNKMAQATYANAKSLAVIESNNNGKTFREALSETTSAIIEAIRVTLEKTPPELSADIMTDGITLTGGGALLHGLDRLIKEETDLTVHVAEDPLSSVAIGTGRILDRL